jgi:hypothetical protein
MSRQVIKTEQKALEINLNDRIYGTFAEIGAGQEVARYFFQVGAAAGTIAKTMSAYDKTYSDAIYGLENTNRYVCESRLEKMLDHEYMLIEERLTDVRPDTNFFVFADTVQAINYTRTIKGNGWVGIRFQHYPGSDANDVTMHVKMLDKNNRQQQEAIGILGVNLIYACYYYRENAEEFIISLLDGLKSRLNIDMISVKGPAFDRYDNRLLCLYLVKNGLSEVAIFNSKRQSLHASEFLYRKEIMVVRGHFRPPTLVTKDAFAASFEQFKEEELANRDACRLLAEITMENLTRFWELNEKDFLDRADMLCELGHTVIISDCSNHQRLINYLADYKIQRLGIVMGVHELLDTIHNKYENNKDGRLLTAFGELFSRNITVYAYPALEKEGDMMVHIDTLPIPEGIRFLYQHLVENKQIVEVTGYNPDHLEIIPGKIYQAIANNEEGTWENDMPEELVKLIKEKGSFGYGNLAESFDYERKGPGDAEYY